MKDKTTVEFPSGMYYQKPTQDWIDMTISINKKEFIEWLQNTDDEENIKIQVLTSKADKKYFKKYTYENKQPIEPEAKKMGDNHKVKIIEDDEFWTS